MTADRGRTDSEDTHERTSTKWLETRIVAVGQVLFNYPLRDHRSDDVRYLDGVFVAKRYESFSKWQILNNVRACYKRDEMLYLRGGDVCPGCSYGLYRCASSVSQAVAFGFCKAVFGQTRDIPEEFVVAQLVCHYRKYLTARLPAVGSLVTLSKCSH